MNCHTTHYVVTSEDDNSVLSYLVLEHLTYRWVSGHNALQLAKTFTSVEEANELVTLLLNEQPCMGRNNIMFRRVTITVTEVKSYDPYRDALETLREAKGKLQAVLASPAARINDAPLTTQLAALNEYSNALKAAIAIELNTCNTV